MFGLALFAIATVIVLSLIPLYLSKRTISSQREFFRNKKNKSSNSLCLYFSFYKSIVEPYICSTKNFYTGH